MTVLFGSSPVGFGDGSVSSLLNTVDNTIDASRESSLALVAYNWLSSEGHLPPVRFAPKQPHTLFVVLLLLLTIISRVQSSQRPFGERQDLFCRASSRFCVVPWALTPRSICPKQPPPTTVPAVELFFVAVSINASPLPGTYIARHPRLHPRDCGTRCAACYDANIFFSASLAGTRAKFYSEDAGDVREDRSGDLRGDRAGLLRSEARLS